MGKFRLLLGSARLPFLLLTPACIALGLASVYKVQGHVDVLQAALVLLGALAAHVSVNAFNEYQDFRSGLDAMTQRTAFSGGSGVLPAHPELAPFALAMAVLNLLVCVGVGLYFVALRGLALFPLGLLGLLLVTAYTRWITRQPILCLLAPGLGFGPLMVVGTYVAMTGSYSLAPAVASLVPFFLVNNLLLLNQFPDVEADRSVGRRHLLVTSGAQHAARWYAVQMVLAFASMLLGVTTGLLPTGALLGLLMLPVAVMTARDVVRHAQTLERLLPAMSRNVAINLLTPVLMALGLWLW